ncbi:MAG: hypothetical protein KDJ16_16910 [Hyphomicrobiales bacterium]|nr:hypothetical protein [Hyphomicrobiales bacterium]
MRSLVLSALLIGLSITSGFAAEGYPRIPVHVVDERDRHPGLAEFIDELQAAVARRDRDAVLSAVSPDFRWERDFGGSFDKSKPAAENFEFAYPLDDALLADEYKGDGWRKLDAKLKARALGPWGEKEWRIDACLPAEPRLGTAETAPDKALEERAGALAEARQSDFWLLWGYVEATDVLVRAKPAASSTALDVVSTQAVWIADWLTVDDLDGVPDRKWVKVNSPAGHTGYIVADFLLGFLEDRICFGKDAAGEWKIIAYIGGGD